MATMHVQNGSAPKRKRGEAHVLVPCSCCCGEMVRKAKRNLNASGLNYVNGKHAGAHRTRVYLEEMCGPFLGLAMKYLDGWAKQHYANVSTIRTALAPFLLFLNEEGIVDLGSVIPETITRYISWADDFDYRNVQHDISVLTDFFKWARRNRISKSPLPVSKFHGKKRAQHLPRPYDRPEMDLIWRLAHERGCSQIRAIIAIGEEAGLRIGEICRLRKRDVDLDGCRLFVRLPNKGKKERWAMFTDRAAAHIGSWIKERGAQNADEALFRNTWGKPYRPESLHRELCRTFCQTYQGEVIHSEGVERWSTHRLRHTMASNLAAGGASIPTIMAAGGWNSPSSMMIYTKIDQSRVRSEYDAAMRRAMDGQNAQTVVELSPDEFLADCEGAVQIHP